MTLVIRQAAVPDIPHLAYFAMEASGGFLDAAYHGVIPDRPTNVIVEHLYSRSGTTNSLENWWVAEQNGEVVGGINAFGAGESANNPPNPLMLEERRYLAKPFSELRELYSQIDAEESYIISSIAAYPEYRGLGIGTALMDHIHGEGKARGFSKMSLEVYAENTRAVELYYRLGYKEVARGPAPEHELIRYHGDLLLMFRMFRGL